ncbi:MAG: class I tRNA ligase family protein, partial [Chlamydiota bacterium]|nr:class I tRNA ligase family protein [Chlamydiota bacterium]
CLVTGHDILFFWVARMIMMGQYLMGEVPFHQVSLQGLIYGKSYFSIKEGERIAFSLEERQALPKEGALPPGVHEKWEKMSKSRGNVVNPLDMVEQYGADATRIALLGTPTMNGQMDLDLRRFLEGQHLVNKIWNAFRYGLLRLSEPNFSRVSLLNVDDFLLEDRWILASFDETLKEFNDHIECFESDKALKSVTSFFWDRFCALYVEISKPILSSPDHPLYQQKQGILLLLLTRLLRLWHPFVPFITESLHQIMKRHFSLDASDHFLIREITETLHAASCQASPFPQPLGVGNNEDISSFECIEEVVKQIRHLRSEMGIPPHMATDCWIYAEEDSLHKGIIGSLLPIDRFLVNPTTPPPPVHSIALFSRGKILLPLPIDLYLLEEKRLEKEISQLRKQQNNAHSQLKKNAFIERAPSHVVEDVRYHLKRCEKSIEELSLTLRQIQKAQEN